MSVLLYTHRVTRRQPAGDDNLLWLDNMQSYGRQKMRVVCVNYTFNPRINDPESLLERYETLVDWADAIKSAGAQVSVVQRFGSDNEVIRNGISYRFVHDPTWKNGSVFDRATRVNAVIAETTPTIIHVNGLQFGRQAVLYKKQAQHTPIVLQDHASGLPRRWLNRSTLGWALHQLDAFSFVSRDQVEPWFQHGLINRNQRIVEMMEGSSHFQLKSQSEARARTGMAGNPLCLWVGRLDSNKDPLTVLHGFMLALPAIPQARLAMVYSSTEFLSAIQGWLRQNPDTAARVQLIGRVPHRALEDIYNSSDIFVLGSHHEGSGFAVLEALSCGVVPVITDIPSFRVLTGGGTVGALWKPEDAREFARVLVEQHANATRTTRRKIREHFEQHFHWSAIGQRAVGVYWQIISSSAH